jgi:hypothetical protein
MAWGSVRLRPGVNVEMTPTLLEAGISASTSIRARDGIPEKLGGWAKFYPFMVGGVPKALHAWADLNNLNHLAVGTTTALDSITSGMLSDITPQTFLSQGPLGTGNGQINFSTVINTPTVTVFDSNIQNVTVLDYVFFNTPVYIPGSGIVLSGLYPIVQITGTNTYQITAAMNATATVNNAGQMPIFTMAAGSATVSVEVDAHGIVAGSAPPANQVVFPITTLGSFAITASIATTTLTATVVPAGNSLRAGTPITGTGVTAGTQITGPTTVTIASGTYTSGSGAVSLTMSSTAALAPGASFTLSGMTGTGAFAQLNGTWTATGGTAGTTVNFTAPTGLTLTITGGNLVANGGIGLYTINLSQTVGSETMTAGTGISINAGAYTALTITNANNFTISGNIQASQAGTLYMNGNQFQLLYYLNLGPPAVGAGYGLGGYGLGGYGTGQVPASMTGTDITALDWTLGNWGEILISCPTGSGIFSWDPTGGFQNSGLIAGAPIFNTGMFIAMPQQMIVTYGSTIQTGLGPLHDPMEVAWCDVGNFNIWTASFNNQAGKFRLSPGSLIVGGRQGPNNALLWTDLDLWTMSYLGAPLVWGFNKVAGGAGLIGQHAHCELNGTVYWMSQTNFHQVGPRGVGTMPCPVWDAVFQNLSTATDAGALPITRKCWAWANTPFNEVWFFYPSANSAGECDSYAKYNELSGAWDYQTGVTSFPRSAGINQSVLGKPISATPTGLIYQHEISPDADGQPLAWSFTTGYFMIGEGEDSAFVDLIIPDFKFGVFGGSSNLASVQIGINVTDDPSGAINASGPYTVTALTPEISDLRLRGRMMSFTFSGNDLGSFVRLGRVRYRWAPDGKHP